MSRSVNKVILIGNLGRDAETKFTPNGIAKTTFAVATSRRWKDQQTGEWKEETDWHNIVLWRSENVANYLTKGTQVYVEGRLQTRTYDDKDGKKMYFTEVIADNLVLLGSRAGAVEAGAEGGYQQSQSRPVSAPRGPQRVQQQPAAPAAPAAPAEESAEFGGATDEDVPF